MSEKHYTINYLENTATFLKKLKEYSYKSFENVKDTILDLGCGTGTDAINLAQSFSVKKVVGIDHDPQMIEKAKTNIQSNSKVDFILSESTKIPFSDNYFDGIRAERLIQHLVKPEETIDEVYRCLKVNQPFVIVETDWASLTFYNENIKFNKKLIDYLTNHKINNGYASRNLISYVEKAGFTNIKIEIFPFVLNTLKEANEYLWIEFIINEASKNGYLTIEEKDILINYLIKSDITKCFACSINMVIVISNK